MRQAFIYIGAPGPGNERVQALLQNHKGFLREQGVLCPRAGRVHPATAIHHQLGHQLLGDPRFDPDAGGLEDLSRELESNRMDKVILSSNMFISMGYRPAAIEELRKIFIRHGYAITWLVYLRSYSSWLESSYIEHLWMRQTNKTFEEWYPTHHNPVLAAPDKLLRAFFATGDPVRLRSYSEVADRFAEDFLSELGLPCPDDVCDPNPARGILHFEMQRLIEQYAAFHLDEAGIARVRMRAVQEQARIPRSPGVRCMSAEISARLEGETRASHEALLKLAGVEGGYETFFGSKATSAPQNVEDLPSSDLADFYQTFLLCALA